MRSVPVFVVVLLAACRPSGPSGHHAPAAHDPVAAIRTIHGGVGPWVVAGHRMGEAALRELGLPRGSMDLEVVHHTPPSVQFSCVADGAAAATGASAGRLNLALVHAEPNAVHTTFKNRLTGKTVAMRPTDGFRARYLNVPKEQLEAAGLEVLSLPEADVFVITR